MRTDAPDPRSLLATRSRRPRGLARRLGLWVAFSSGASLLLFAATAYIVVIVEENNEEEKDSPEVIEREARTQVGDALLIGGPLCLALSATGAIVFARRALRPLDDVISAAARITPRDLSARLPVDRVEDEAQSVVTALNGLLGRLESGFASLGHFAADASHELRTPLTVVAAELDVSLSTV